MPIPNTAKSRLTVFDLSLPQQIFLWALRHVEHYGVISVYSGIGKVVGESSIERATRAFKKLAAEISACTSDDNTIVEPWTKKLSNTELDLLRLTALAQRGASISFSVARLSWVRSYRAESVSAAIESTALVLKQADEFLPLMDTQVNPENTVLLPPTIVAHQLSDIEAIVLVSIRVWVRAALNRQATTPPLLDYLVPRRMGSLVQPMCAILRNTASNATRLLDVHCPQCKSLSIDEARLLHAFGGAQRNERFTVEKIVATWLNSPHSHKLAMDADELAQRMLRLDLSLPGRDWRFPEIHGGASSWATEEDRVARTLH